MDIEAIRARVEEWDNDPRGSQTAHEVAEDRKALLAEVDRLWEAIYAHMYGIAADSHEERLERNRRLWGAMQQGLYADV